jgi:hypothetical protein
MSTAYMGWRVPEKIIIVAKECRFWDKVTRQYTTDNTYQGYVVEPGNKEMLENALGWAKWTEYKGEYNKDTRRYDEQIEHEGEIHEFVNEGFTLELLETAGGSSQGGKLSFWNCKVSKDGKEFIIGIASDYLLDILKYNDFIKGVCQATLSFARCKGGVGMMNKEMPSYQQFLQDEQHRAAMKKGKTKKREPGHLYSTLTGGDVYFGTFYRWYEPVYEETRGWYKKLVGYKKLSEPVVRYWQPWYDEEFTKMSEYLERSFYFSDSTPARTDSGVVAEIDMTNEEVVEWKLSKIFAADNDGYSPGAFWEYVGLSASNESYEMPDYVKQWLISKGCKVWD